MTPKENPTSASSASRRRFLEVTGGVAAATTLAAASVPQVHAAEENTIRLALIGCGGRGTGAGIDALSVKNGPIELVAMADVMPHRLKASHASLKNKFGKRVDVPEDRQFIGFDAYKHAMDLLKPGDVAILTTPPAFRWVMFQYAIQRGLNVFMEKPVAVDGPSSRRMFELGEKSIEKNLKVGVGLMCRHCDARGELAQRIRDEQLGELTLLRAYRMAGPTGSAAVGKKPKNENELMYQIKHFHGFLWLSGGAVSDFLIHNIDECCWMKDDFPIRAKASGGRHYRGNKVDQNFDNYSIEFTFADGTKALVGGRTIPGCHNEFATYVHGTKGSAIVSTSGHLPAKSRIYKGHVFQKKDLVWAYPQPERNPYRIEWIDLIDAIRNNKPYNEVERGVKASLVTAMGRKAAHTGVIVTYEDMLEGDEELGKGVDKLTIGGPSPLQANSNGEYPIPYPGIITDAEYGYL